MNPALSLSSVEAAVWVSTLASRRPEPSLYSPGYGSAGPVSGSASSRRMRRANRNPPLFTATRMKKASISSGIGTRRVNNKYGGISCQNLSLALALDRYGGKE